MDNANKKLIDNIFELNEAYEKLNREKAHKAIDNIMDALENGAHPGYLDF